MNTRNVTGLTLIIAPVVVIISWIIWSMLDPDGPSASGIRANADILQPLCLVVLVALSLWSIGLFNLSRTMLDGDGGDYANIGGLMILAALPVIIAEIGLYYASGSIADAVLSDNFYTGGQAVGMAGTLIQFVGFGIVGISILLQKNFNQIIAWLFILVGIVGAVICIIAYDSQLLGIAYVGYVIATVLVGINQFRAKA